MKPNSVPDSTAMSSILEAAVRDMHLTISMDDLRAFELFASELKKWNRKINLTALTTGEEIAIKHIVDSLVFAGKVRDGECVLDIGSGAGFPAIPTKITRPEVFVVSIDAVEKKILFQRHVARLLGLHGFEALHVRAERLPEIYPRRFDVITSRAFSSLKQFVALAAPLLSEKGRLVAMKGPAACGEMQAAEEGLRKLGFEISDIYSYGLPLNMGNRNLITIIPREAA